MKHYNVAELILLILAGTVAFVLCTYVAGAVFGGSQTSEANIELRMKIVDLLQMIAGAVIGVTSSMISHKKPPEKKE